MSLTTCDVTIIGAGPFGLSAAAHLRKIPGLETRVFGKPMTFWQHQMPAGMLLRSSWTASSISGPGRSLTLNAYESASGDPISTPVPIHRFIEYGRWFQRHAVPDLDERKVAKVEKNAAGFRVALEDGEVFHSRRVVVAAGIGSFAWRPPEFRELPASLASHAYEQRVLKRFSGKEVLVIGGGQSALECAALLHEGGASVEVLVRRPRIHWLSWRHRLQQLGFLSKLAYSPTDVGPPGISRLVAVPDMLRPLPREIQDLLRKRCIRPAGAHWLQPRLRDVTLTTGRHVVSVLPIDGRLKMVLDNGDERRVDHVLLGTGYRVDILRYDFLAADLVCNVRCVNGYPDLARGLETSVPGLHFLGAPASWSFGPLMLFVSGTEYAARALTRCIARRIPVLREQEWAPISAASYFNAE